MKVTISQKITAPIEKVWYIWTNPNHIIKWNFASDDWYCPKASNDLKVGWKFVATMSSKDWKFSFDFEWVYTKVEENKLIEYEMADGREVSVRFEVIDNKVKVTETFDSENENPIDMQRDWWQAILDNFKKYVEGK